MSLQEALPIAGSQRRPWKNVLARTLPAIGCAMVLSQVHPAHAQQPDYVIGPRDVLSVTVWDQPGLSGKFTVESDGAFTFPLVGRVRAAGLALHDVEDRLKQRLADGFFKDPQLS